MADTRTSTIALNVATGTPFYVPFDVSNEDGFYSLQLATAGGSLTVDLECSNDGTNFVAPEGATSIVSAMAAGSKFKAFDVPVCEAFRLKLTATSSAVTGTLTVTRK